MAAKEKDQASAPAPDPAPAPECKLEVAVSHLDLTNAELDDMIEGASEEQTQAPDLQLRPRQKPPTVAFSAVGCGRSNAAAKALTVIAANDHALASPFFEAVHARFNEAAQAIIAIPVLHYQKGKPHQYRVTWSTSGQEMRCDLNTLLTAKNWSVPIGKERHVPVSMRRNNPSRGTCLIFHLKDSWLEDTKAEKAKKKREREKRAQSSEAP